MKAEEINKASAVAGKGSFTVDQWPETDEEMLSHWGTSLVCNHAEEKIRIVARAKWEAHVLAYFIEHGETVLAGKRTIAAPLAKQTEDMIEEAQNHAAGLMLDFFPPTGEHNRLTEAEKLDRMTSKMSDDAMQDMIDREIAKRGLKVKASK